MTPPVPPVAPATPAPPANPVLADAIREAQKTLDASRAAAPAAIMAPGDDIAPPENQVTPTAPTPPNIAPAAPQPPSADAPAPDAAQPPADTPPAADAPPVDAAPPVEKEVVILPGRRPDDPPFEFEVPKGEAAERLRQAVNSGMRGEEFDAAMAEAESLRDQAFLEQDRLVVDPVGFLAPLPPQERASAALTLLADPSVLGMAAEALTQLLDDDTREGAIKDLRLRRSEGERERAEWLKERGLLRRAQGEIRDIIQALIPPTLSEAHAKLFITDAVADVRRAIEQSEHGFVHPKAVPRLLQPRLEAFGMTEAQIAQAVAALGSGRRGRRPLAPPPSPPPTPAAPARVVATPTTQQLAAGQANRTTLRTPPPGAGAPSPERTVTRGLTIEQAIAERVAQRAARPV